MIELAVAIACLAAAALAAMRWLRVVQREQYYVSAARFARRWWLAAPLNVALGLVAVLGALGAPLLPLAALLTAGAVALGPLGLGLRGRTAPLVWRPRLIRLAALLAGLSLLVLALIAVLGALLGLDAGHAAAVGAAGVALLQPLLADAAVALAWPLEGRLMRVFVERARRRLDQVRPTIVAITGSYGKTSTKGYVRHLLSGDRQVVASPASFNNTGGLARTVNEHLVPGTEVFVAEMGTFGPGEIRDLCRWIPPDVSVITAIGPVHLERMGSLDVIVRAKAEILEQARTCVLNVDAHGLAEVANGLPADKVVWRCSTIDESADVFAAADEAGNLRVLLRGSLLGEAAGLTAQPINVACAVAVALALGVAEEAVAGRLAGLPSADHRLQVASGSNGATVIDDTYNSNPAGSRAALAALLRVPAERRFVVTPGMVELGDIQATENEAFARAAAAAVDELLIVNRTNRAALTRGASGGRAAVRHFDRREQAVAWVRANLGPGDAVLYENDLPDIYP